MKIMKDKFGPVSSLHDELSREAWKRLRLNIINERGLTCECCGKPCNPELHEIWDRRFELALWESCVDYYSRLNNLLLLCKDCHIGWHGTKYTHHIRITREDDDEE